VGHAVRNRAEFQRTDNPSADSRAGSASSIYRLNFRGGAEGKEGTRNPQEKKIKIGTGGGGKLLPRRPDLTGEDKKVYSVAPPPPSPTLGKASVRRKRLQTSKTETLS